MKTILLLTSLISSGASALTLPSRTECKARTANAERLVKIMEDRFAVGEVTRTDVSQTKLALVDLQITCADIVRGDAGAKGSYCSQENVDVLSTFVKGVAAEVAVGMREASELLTSQDYELKRNATCE